MPRNLLLDETKEPQWPVGLPGWADKVRVQPTITEILDDARPATIGKGDQLINGALERALIAGIITGRWIWVYNTVGTILSLGAPSGKSLPEREAEAKKPLAKVAR